MRIFALSESAVTVEFGNVISLELNRQAMDLAHHLDSSPFNGYIESVPAYASLTVFYDITIVRKAYPDYTNAFDAVCDLITATGEQINTASINDTKLIEIPAKFDLTNGPDLESAASYSNLTVTQFIDLFTSRVYRVFMLGFLPGFAYMGEVDEKIALPRLASPRQNVPAGSIGIAGKQTGIYPYDSPGGWQLIGRTERKIFDIKADIPCLFEPGNIVKFIQI